jgi:hypothetical protein
VPEDRARIVVMDGGFHGRTTTVVGFSTDPDARGGFGPFTPGFDVVPYGPADPTADAVRAAIGPDTVAVLLEPVQGEAGVVVPPPGYLAAVREACTAAGRAPGRRRGAVRARPDRARARDAGDGRRRRRPPARQGARRRDPAGLGRRRRPRRPRRPEPGPARQHVRRQPAGLRRRVGGGGPAARGQPARAGRRAGRGAARAPRCPGGAGGDGGARARPVGRRRRRRGARDGPRGVRGARRARGPGQGHPRCDDPPVARRW